MLQRLVIKNFSLIDDQEIIFSPGLNAITGESGAGKSLLLDAIQVGLGRRAAANLVRAGAARAVVQCIFDLQVNPNALVDTELDDGFLILDREVHLNGRSIYRINGRVVTAVQFRQVGDQLVDFHGQGEQQGLLRESRHRAVLDRFSAEASQALAEVERLYREWADTRRRLDELRDNSMERTRRRDVLVFQVQEIDAAHLHPGDEEELEREHRRLVHATRIAELANLASAIIYHGDGRQKAAGDQIAEALAVLEELAALDPDAQGLVAALEPALYQLQELGHDLSPYCELTDLDPQRLEYVEERLSLLRRLKQKYGVSVEDIIGFRNSAAAELDGLSGTEDEIQALEAAIEGWAEKWRVAAEVLSAARLSALRSFEQAVALELRQLEVGEAAFQVVLRPVDGITAFGAEDVFFLLSPNPGEPALPLAKIASGGELSRVMLALKRILSLQEDVPTLVFDEADAGVGGRALDAVAEKLAEIGRHHQVLCVTHAAQLAGLADRHLQIVKTTSDGQTWARVNVLAGEERVAELARMLAGRKTSENVRRHARELLGRGDPGPVR